MDAMNPYAAYEQRPREYIPTPDFGLAQMSRTRQPDKRSVSNPYPTLAWLRCHGLEQLIKDR